MEPYQILFLYNENDKKEALETYEDLQSELSALKIPFRTQKGKALTIYHCTVSFVDIDKKSKLKAFQQKIFAPIQFKKDENWDLESLTDKLSYHSYPFQSLVELVLDIQKEVLINSDFQTYIKEANFI